MADIVAVSPLGPDDAVDGSRAGLEAIEAFLTVPLEKLQPGLGLAACDYVLRAGSDRVLARMAGLGAVPHAHAHLSSLLGYQADREGQRVFLAAQGWDPAAVRRLGGLLAAAARCGGYDRGWPGTASSPDFVRALAHVTVNLLQEVSAPPGGWLLTASRCLELLALAGRDQAQLVDVLFAQAREDRQGHRRLLALSGLAQALAADPGRTLQGARGLEAAGARRFLQYLGQPGLLACPAFLDHLLETLQGGGPHTEPALTALAAGEPALQRQCAARLLAGAAPAGRIAGVRLLRRMGTPAARALLEQHQDDNRAVIEERRQALWLLGLLADGRQRATAEGAQGYVALDGEWIAIPPPPPALPDTALPPGFAQALRAAVAETNRDARLSGHAAASGNVVPYDEAAVEGLLAVLEGTLPPQLAAPAVRQLLDRGTPGQAAALTVETFRGRLETVLSQPGITAHHLARALALEPGGPERWAARLAGRDVSSLPARLLRQQARDLRDLRPVLEAAAPAVTSQGLMAQLLRSHPPGWARALVEGPVPLVGAVVAAHLDMIDQAFGLAAAPLEGRYRRFPALTLLSLLPAVPRRYLDVLIDRAVRGRPEERTLARALLSAGPGLQEPLGALLVHSDAAVRRAVAQWLRERGDRGALPWLRAALETEESDSVRAALLDARAALGDDLADALAEPRLQEAASQGLARTRSRVGRCVPLAHLPPLTWADGRPVPADLVRWWVVLADRLKDPRGNAFLDILLGRLGQESAARLGELVLSAFVSYDTRRPTEAQANAYADAQADHQLQRLRQGRGSWTDETLRVTREQLFARLKAQRLREYVHSAQAHAGVLALASRATPGVLVSLIGTYLREHPRRTPQGRALLSALAHHGSPEALQLLSQIARGYRRRYQREHAAARLDALARERGLTREGLADRTIPAGGLDERGVLRLPAARGDYTAQLDAAAKVVLRNPQGRRVQGLPAGSAGGRALTGLRKTLKETLPVQTVRLHEAMCVGRLWRPEELEVLLTHPLAGRLCARLVFAGVSETGGVTGTFRPLGDGTLSGAADEPVDLSTFAAARIAHRVLLSPAQGDAWQRHLADYRVTPLFEQLGRPLLTPAPAQIRTRAITEREGWMLDTATLRAVAGRLGYQRGRVRHGGTFASYEKPFAAAGLTAVIEVTGSLAAARSVPCALRSLRITGTQSAEDREGVPLSAVPPVLLCETWNDLRDIAAAGSGFDPQWRGRAMGA